VAFAILALPGFWLARALWRMLPEPPRHSAREPESATPPMGLVEAVAFTVRIRTNLLLIVSSALGYFFFAGLQTFALLFVRGRYHAGQATAELVLAMLVAGALVGTLVGGWLTDLLGRHGYPQARVFVPAVCYLGAAVLLVPGFFGTAVTPALWFDVGGAALLSAANPGLDAARLDIVPAALWGRAESARTLVRSLAQAVAPLTFGGLADLIAGIAPGQAPPGTHAPAISPGAARGLEITFLLMLTALIAAGVFLLKALRTYRADVEAVAVPPRS
jgi:sugar phosphate permease